MLAITLLQVVVLCIYAAVGLYYVVIRIQEVRLRRRVLKRLYQGLPLFVVESQVVKALGSLGFSDMVAGQLAEAFERVYGVKPGRERDD